VLFEASPSRVGIGPLLFFVLFEALVSPHFGVGCYCFTWGFRLMWCMSGRLVWGVPGLDLMMGSWAYSCFETVQFLC
jgi:hypothetical protein